VYQYFSADISETFQEVGAKQPLQCDLRLSLSLFTLQDLDFNQSDTLNEKTVLSQGFMNVICLHKVTF
jgi:hypothetical protein